MGKIFEKKIRTLKMSNTKLWNMKNVTYLLNFAKIPKRDINIMKRQMSTHVLYKQQMKAGRKNVD